MLLVAVVPFLPRMTCFEQFLNLDINFATVFSQNQRMDSGSSLSEPFNIPQATVTMSNRRRRRGVVEKKRRDRINNSLAELRRLIPPAIGKQGFQGSTKSEKSEILQMTVDYLKSLRCKANGGNYEPRNDLEPFAAGFQECIDETDRCLQSLLSTQDAQSLPIKTRLMSHLRSCISRWDSYNMPHTSPQLISPSNGWSYFAAASHLPTPQTYLSGPLSHPLSFTSFPKSKTQPYLSSSCLGTSFISSTANPCAPTAQITETADVPCATNPFPYSGLPFAP